MSDGKKSLFDKLYDAGKEELKQLKKPLMKNKVQRKLQAAYDSAVEQRLDAESALEEARHNIQNYDVNNVLKQQEIIMSADSTIDAIKKEYAELFGEELKV